MTGRPAGDDELLAHLARMWSVLDPVPDDLVERVLFAVDLESLESFQAELLTPVPTLLTAATRGEPEEPGEPEGPADPARTATFASEQLTVVLTWSPGSGHAPSGTCRLDGWILPAGEYRIEVRTAGGAGHTVSDRQGRFALEAQPTGPTQLLVRAGDTGAPPSGTFTTPTFTL